ncbi:MAG: C25 family cysteine peptidase [Candidatus Korarchaeota archaeon]
MKYSLKLRVSEHKVAIVAFFITISVLGIGCLGIGEVERKVPLIGSSGHGPSPALLIIVNESNFDAVLEFANWKTQQGFPTKVITLEEILNTTEGRDLQEKIRNLIIHMHNTWGIRYVLLVGDVDSIPTRYLYVNDGQDGSPFKPSDYYYWTTEGSFDENDNNIFGDEEDFVWFPSVAVGRIPASSPSDIQNILRKIMWYESGNISLDGWTTDVLAIGASISSQYQGRRIAEYISQTLFDHFCNVTRLYHDPYSGIANLSEEAVTSYLNMGVSIMHVASHGTPTELQSSGGLVFLKSGTLATLNNTGKWSLIFAGACNTARLDKSSLGKVSLISYPGGAICYIGATAVSWGGDDISDYSDCWIEYIFLKELLSGKSVGEALLSTKVQYAALMAETIFKNEGGTTPGLNFNIARKEQINYIIYGDPTLFPYVGAIKNITVDIEGNLKTLSTIAIKVADAHGNPLDNVLVAVSNSTWSVSVKTVNGVAYITLPGTPGEYNITASGGNVIPKIKTISVEGEQKIYPIPMLSYNLIKSTPARVEINIKVNTSVKGIAASCYCNGLYIGTGAVFSNEGKISIKLYSVKGAIVVVPAVTLESGEVVYLPPIAIEIYLTDAAKGEIQRGGTMRYVAVFITVAFFGVALYSLWPEKKKHQEDEIVEPEW